MGVHSSFLLLVLYVAQAGTEPYLSCTWIHMLLLDAPPSLRLSIALLCVSREDAINTNVYIGNVSQNWTESDLRNLFTGKCGGRPGSSWDTATHALGHTCTRIQTARPVDARAECSSGSKMYPRLCCSGVQRTDRADARRWL